MATVNMADCEALAAKLVDSSACEFPPLNFLLEGRLSVLLTYRINVQSRCDSTKAAVVHCIPFGLVVRSSSDSNKSKVDCSNGSEADYLIAALEEKLDAVQQLRESLDVLHAAD
jgi:hypothetical protein